VVVRDGALIRSASAPLSELLPDYFVGTSQGAPAGRITLEQVLTMSAGFEWDEWSTAATRGRSSAACSTRFAERFPPS
jgi:CubicO group peptidase (beta-lactamase class C family)